MNALLAYKTCVLIGSGNMEKSLCYRDRHCYKVACLAKALISPLHFFWGRPLQYKKKLDTPALGKGETLRYLKLSLNQISAIALGLISAVFRNI